MNTRTVFVLYTYERFPDLPQQSKRAGREFDRVLRSRHGRKRRVDPGFGRKYKSVKQRIAKDIENTNKLWVQEYFGLRSSRAIHDYLVGRWIRFFDAHTGKEAELPTLFEHYMKLVTEDPELDRE